MTLPGKSGNGRPIGKYEDSNTIDVVDVVLLGDQPEPAVPLVCSMLTRKGKLPAIMKAPEMASCASLQGGCRFGARPAGARPL